jgi:hypothetical protein
LIDATQILLLVATKTTLLAVNNMLLSGIGFRENPTNARLVHAEAPRDLDLALAPALFAR